MKKSLLFCVAILVGGFLSAQTASEGGIGKNSRVKIGLNFYSFDSQLKNGVTDIFKVIQYAASIDMGCVDITGYYFPDYPKVPSDQYIYEVKRCAFRNAVAISGTSVRNDFSKAQTDERNKEIQLVKNWIVVASKLGANTTRIFTGPNVPIGYTWDEAAKWIAASIDECAEYAKQYGIMIAIQNHHDFLKTSDQINTLLSMCSSDNVGLMLDVGTLRMGDPYAEIERVIKRAITWQIKEHVYIKGVKTNLDINRLMKLIQKSKYRGYLPMEVLGDENKEDRIESFLAKLRNEIDPN